MKKWGQWTTDSNELCLVALTRESENWRVKERSRERRKKRILCSPRRKHPTEGLEVV